MGHDSTCESAGGIWCLSLSLIWHITGRGGCHLYLSPNWMPRAHSHRHRHHLIHLMTRSTCLQNRAANRRCGGRQRAGGSRGGRWWRGSRRLLWKWNAANSLSVLYLLVLLYTSSRVADKLTISAARGLDTQVRTHFLFPLSIHIHSMQQKKRWILQEEKIKRWVLLRSVSPCSATRSQRQD